MLRAITLSVAFALCSCGQSVSKEEKDRQNIFFAEFYYEEGFPARSLKHARQIKPDSPHYDAAQQWIALAGGDGEESN